MKNRFPKLTEILGGLFYQCWRNDSVSELSTIEQAGEAIYANASVSELKALLLELNRLIDECSSFPERWEEAISNELQIDLYVDGGIKTDEEWFLLLKETVLSQLRKVE